MKERNLELHLDEAEPHILTSTELMEHEDGRFVPRLATEGVTELIVFKANIVNLHAQFPPPVPDKEKHRKKQNQQAPEKRFGEEHRYIYAYILIFWYICYYII